MGLSRFGRLSRRRVALFLGLVGGVAGYSGSAFAGQDCTTGPFVNGVDVYSGQGTINWATAAGAGIGFAYIKASQGDYDTDSQFQKNWTNTKAAGVVRGAYHFLDPTISGVTQANFFLNIMGTLQPGDLPPMLDIECPSGNDEPDSDDCLGIGSSGDASGSAILKVMNDWMTTVEAATHRTPVIYTYGSYFEDDSIDTTGFEKYPLYIAYPTTSTCFNYPDPWTSPTIWQNSFTGTVSGISGEVDLDRFLGTKADLTAFTGLTLDGGTVDASVPPTPYVAPAQVNGNDSMSLVSWPDGHIELYASTTAGSASRIDSEVSTTTPADTWSAPVSLGGSAACGVASVFWAAGSGHTTEIFDGLANGTTESCEYVSAMSAYIPFAAFGGTGLNHLSTVAYPDSHVEVFALGDDGALWHNVSTQSSWGGWAVLSPTAVKFATSAGPILWNDGHAEVFVADVTGTVWHNATSAPEAGTGAVWGGWKSIAGGPIASRPIPARWADGHVQVFARGTDDTLYTSEYASGFPAFTPLNPTQTFAGEPSVLVYPSYGPEIFARGAKNDVIHMWNTAGVWSAWADDFGQVSASDPMAWLRPDNLAEVFAIDASGNVVKSLHDSSTWSTWSTIGSGFDACQGGTTLIDAGTPVMLNEAGAPVDAGIALDGSPGGTTKGPDGGLILPGADAGTQGSSGGGCTIRRGPGRDGTDGVWVFAMLAGAGVVLRRKRWA
jgi:GH25 family lysozyme M1 (1,4-beta-N-acetylmuramidase)